MSDFLKFRPALNGFSRTDVVKYIEETSAQHQKALQQLDAEKAQLSAENEELSAEDKRLNTSSSKRMMRRFRSRS